MPFECDIQAKRLARYRGERRQKGLLGEQSSRLVARAEPPHARHPRLLARHAAVRQQSHRSARVIYWSRLPVTFAVILFDS